MANSKPKKVIYSEPDDYIPKDIYNSVFGNNSGKKTNKPTTTKKPANKKPTSKKK